MSWWTHIVAAIDVDTYICKDNDIVVNEVYEFLKGAPEIIGSEGNANVFVNILPGYNCYTSADCNRCEYNPSIVRGSKCGFQCDSPDGYKCPDGEYQSRVVITVIGDLRDRMLEETQKEWDDFKAYVDGEVNENGYIVRNCSCNILVG